ncbi:transposase [Candidatus Kaiserbacteria bacterium]|nr:transposase [Candidatus Kaiserbacteria bacterium]
MDIVCYERDQGFVLERFQEGEFDYMDTASEVVETEFFRYIGAKKILKELAATYPSPRKKHDVPVWFYMASNISMRLHGVHSFNAYPYVVRCGGMLNAFGPELGHKTKHPETGDVTLSCAGFNEKNDYDRQTPCDQDYLRKFARATDAQRLMAWFNSEVAKVFKLHKAFDPEGIFSGDASYLFVPDNPAYENSARMLFDENNHPVEAESLKKMAPQKAARCQWRRCYKMVSLLHTDRQRTFFTRIAMRIVPGNDHECPILYDLVDEFVAAVGTGIIKRLILDRGFIDGAKIGHCKLAHGIDILMPIKKNMDIYQDALGLLKLPNVQFSEVLAPAPRPIAPARLPQAPEPIRLREAKRQKTVAARKAQEPAPAPEKTLVKSEVAGLSNLTSLDSCPVSLQVIVNRETYADGHQDIWMLLDTKTFEKPEDPAGRREEYHLRTDIEEGHRQLKCFWDLTKFTSRAFSLVVNQVIFVALTYNLLQLHLKRQGREELNRRTRPRVYNQLLPNAAFIIIYCQNHFALFTSSEYTKILLTLPKKNQDKILHRTQRLEREMVQELHSPRPP